MQLTGNVTAGASAELLERSGDLSILGARLASVTESTRGHLLLVRGEAGIGKTSLMRCFCDGLGRRSRVLWAACDPLFTPRPLGPLLDVARETDGELRARVEGGARPHDVALALLGELSGPAPAVLVLEDVHWADEATLDVMRLLARRIESVPVLLVVSYRHEQLHRTHPLQVVLGELPTGRAVTRLELLPLSRDAVAALAEESPLDADDLFERTAGNPFFVSEVLAAESERVPATVRDAVLARAARLSGPARVVLEAVAVVPQATELWLLEALTHGTVGSLDECVSSGMLRAVPGGIAFRHELARLAIEESLSPDRALALHRRAIAALSRPPAGAQDFARLAHHGEAAGDADAVLRFAAAAAEHAASVGAHREAEAQLARALRFADAAAPEDRADLLERFANESYFTDMRAPALDALDQALAIHRELDDVIRQGHVQQLRCRTLVCTGRIEEARAAGEQAVALLEPLPPGPELARAYSALSEVGVHSDDVESTTHWAILGTSLAERVGDPEALVLALNSLGTIEAAQGRPEGEDKLKRSIEVAKRAGLAVEVARGYINLLAGLSRSHAWGQAEQLVESAIEWCREHGLEAFLRYAMCAQAELHLIRGRWTEAADVANSIVGSPSNDLVGPRCMALEYLAMVRLRRGDPGYWPLLDEQLEISRATGELQHLGPVAAARAEAAWLEGRQDAIAEETDAAFALAVDLDAPMFVGALACWRWRAGVLMEAPAGIEEVYRLSIAGDAEGAARLWEAAGYPYEAALARTDSAQSEVLRAALDTFRELGARPAEATVVRRLRALGERGLPRGPRPRTRENPAGLTARELELLPLLSEGLRNAEIAERLVVTEKTVGHHVSAILRKLGIRSRGEVAARARTLGLLGTPEA